MIGFDLQRRLLRVSSNHQMKTASHSSSRCSTQAKRIDADTADTGEDEADTDMAKPTLIERLTDGDPPEDGALIEVFFSGDEILRAGRMLRAEADGKFSTFVHDLAMRAVADWEAEQANERAATTAAD